MTCEVAGHDELCGAGSTVKKCEVWSMHSHSPSLTQPRTSTYKPTHLRDFRTLWFTLLLCISGFDSRLPTNLAGCRAGGYFAAM